MFNLRKSNLNKIKTFIRNSKEIEIEKNDKEELIKMIRPTVGVKTKSKEDINIKVGKSKIGGRPDLPKDFEWPITNGKPMLFCAQYNISEFTKYDKENLLPKKGFFYIFLSLDEKWNDFNGQKQDFKFLYIDFDNPIRTDFPMKYQENHSFKSAEIEYFELYTIPHYSNYKLSNLDEKYDDLGYHFNELTEDYIRDILDLGYDNYHQILGHDRSIQSSVVYEFSSKELGLYGADASEYKKKWNNILNLSKTYEILLQLDCYDSNSDLTKFGGSGTYYFGISKLDLEKKNFNNIKMSFQST